MLGSIITALALRRSGLTPRPSGSTDTPLRADVVRELLRDALLLPEQLPEGFAPVGAVIGQGRTVASLFIGSEYDGLFAGEVQARFVQVGSGQLLEQHIGLLRPEALRARAEELEAAPALVHGGARRAHEAPSQCVPIGDPLFAERLARRYDRCVRLSAVFLRRYSMMMALATWQIGERTDAYLRAGDIAAAADARWSRVADLLR